ncbi:MAG TPA: DNA translocase FtsK 4TM domain-containing protein, partial [Alphaproteobacteria bacterium]|nr:DNA translocase FtsK 4TM domain-containing protein [Alphaproteobacteria bacterium]
MPQRTLIRSARTRTRTKRTWMPESLRDTMVRGIHIAIGACIIALALAIALAMFTYDPRDISWNTAASTTYSTITHNWVGSFGSHSADVIWQFFGFSGVLIAVILASWGWRVASGRGLDLLLWRILASFVALLTFSVTFAIFNFKFSAGGPALGGAFGKIAATSLTSLLPAAWGGYLIVAIMLVIALIALYMACALTLDEWQVVAGAIHDAIMWAAYKVYR